MKPEAFKTVRTIGLKLTQKALASLLGVHVLTVSAWERGIRPIPDSAVEALRMLGFICELAEHLDASSAHRFRLQAIAWKKGQRP